MDWCHPVDRSVQEVMENGDGTQVDDQAWQPLRLVARFRARVAALSGWESPLPVMRDVAGESKVSENGEDRFQCDVAYVCDDATPSETLVRQEAQRGSPG